MGTSAAVAVLIRKEREMVAAFRGRGATSPGSAVTLDALNLHSGLALRRLQDHAVIRPGRDGTFYLDEPSWDATNRLRRRVMMLILLVIVILIATGVIQFTVH